MTDKHYQLIGRVVVNFQTLEHTLKYSLPIFTGLEDEVTKTLTANLNFSSIVKFVKELSFIKYKMNKPILNSISLIIEELNNVQGLRNDIVHSYYLDQFRADNKTIQYRMNKKIKNSIMGKANTFTDKYLLDIDKKISTAFINLSKLRNDIQDLN